MFFNLIKYHFWLILGCFFQNFYLKQGGQKKSFFAQNQRASMELGDCMLNGILKIYRTQEEAGWQEYKLYINNALFLTLSNTDSLEVLLPLTAQAQQVIVKYRASRGVGIGCESDLVVYETTLPALALPILANEVVISYPLTENDIPDIHISMPAIPAGYEI